MHICSVDSLFNSSHSETQSVVQADYRRRRKKQPRLQTGSTSMAMQNMRSTGRSRITIQGVEMGRIRVGFRD